MVFQHEKEGAPTATNFRRAQVKTSFCLETIYTWRWMPINTKSFEEIGHKPMLYVYFLVKFIALKIPWISWEKWLSS